MRSNEQTGNWIDYFLTGPQLSRAGWQGGLACREYAASCLAAELAGAFAKRLRNVLPPNTVTGRWSTEEFVAILHAPVADAIKVAKAVGEQLSGTYSCLLDGKVVRPDLQVRVTVVDRTEGDPERLLARVREFMTRTLAVPA